MSATSPLKEMAVLGPYVVAENKAGAYLILKRNPNYWKHDASGRQLPYIDSVRLDIQQNRDIEMVRLTHGEIDFINSLDAEYFDKLASTDPAWRTMPAFRSIRNSCGSTRSRTLRFRPTRKPGSPRPTSVMRFLNPSIAGHGPHRISRSCAGGQSGCLPANKFWFNAKLQAHPFDQKAALQSLAQDGFQLQGETLRDRDGHAVEFSVITNSGNKYRERMATMMQQDLSGIGIKLNVVTLDFPSLIERMTRTFDYEACLLGLVNTDLDPNSLMNVWLSSSENHQWNPKPEDSCHAWEAEIDRLMKEQASTLDPNKRKEASDHVQEIVWQQEPFIYLVNKNALSAVSTSVHNVHPVALRPQVYWNIDQLPLTSEVARNH